MPTVTPEKGKKIALAVLAAVCAWLIYSNLIAPAKQSIPASQTTAAGQRDEGLRSSSSTSLNDAARRGRKIDENELASLDPTLRLDLLEKNHQVKYEGSFRNIFQFYTPPLPKPVSNPMLPLPSQPVPPPAPPVANIPLKFYGVASRPGSSEKKAFLSEGDDIYVGQEGETIDKNYKITRIGVNSIEMEDVRTKLRQQLPLVEE